MSDVTQLSPSEPASGDGLRRLSDVRVELSVEIGRTTMSLGDALLLGPGSVVAVDRLSDEPADLLVNGKTVARGEVVVIDSEYGLRITEVVGTDDPVSSVASSLIGEPFASAAAPDDEFVAHALEPASVAPPVGDGSAEA